MIYHMKMVACKEGNLPGAIPEPLSAFPEPLTVLQQRGSSRETAPLLIRCSPHLEQSHSSLCSAIIAASSIHDPSFDYQKTSLSLRLSVFHLQARIGHQPAQAVIATRIVLYV